MIRDALRKALSGYALALLAWGVAFGVRWALADWFPPGFPYLTFFPAVVVVAYFAGLRPAIVTAVLSGLSAWWFWIGPVGLDWSLATSVALGFYAFVVAVDIFFIVGMNSARADLELEARRSAELAQSRDLLLKEVQHRVSNNIQVVSSLLKLESAVTTDVGARRALTEAAARTAVIAQVQRGLLDADGRAAPFSDLAGVLVADALKAAGRDDVTVHVRPSTVILAAEEATPVMLTLLECVNNALEHGLPNRPGVIEVTLTDGAEAVLAVRDDGAGLPDGFNPVEARSLGLRIIQGLAGQLRGRFEMTPAWPGTVCTLTWTRAAV